MSKIGFPNQLLKKTKNLLKKKIEKLCREYVGKKSKFSKREFLSNSLKN